MSCIPIDYQGQSGWRLAFSVTDEIAEQSREVLFALGNGVIVFRDSPALWRDANRHYPGTYFAGCYAVLQSEVAGQIDDTESLVRLPDWTALRLQLRDGTYINVDDCSVEQHDCQLDMRTGTVYHEWVLTDHVSRTTRLCERHLVSMDNPHLCAMELTVTPLNWSEEVALTAKIQGGLDNHNVARYQDHEHQHTQVVATGRCGRVQHLTACAQRTELHIHMACQTTIAKVASGAASNSWAPEHTSQCWRFNAVAQRPFTVEKRASVAVDKHDLAPQNRSDEGLQTELSFAELEQQSHRQWDRLWRATGLQCADADTAQKLRFHAFHLLQSVSPHSAQMDVGVPSRGWHGEGYRGHIFWDELFVLPFYFYRFPDIARAKLLYRYHRLPQARASAKAAGYRGAMFPWRSARSGSEVTPDHQKNLVNGHWLEDPTDLQRHIGSAVVYNYWRYFLISGDQDFLARYGAEVILEVARFWASIAQYNAATDRYEIKGVIGPDEYHNRYPDREEPGLNNNTYTNIMAVWTLCRALDLCEILPSARFSELQKSLQLGKDELSLWSSVSKKMTVSFVDDNVLAQFERFEQLAPFDRHRLPSKLQHTRIDWALEAQGSSADHFQVTKQADTLTLFYLLREEEIAEIFRRLGYSYRHEMLVASARYYFQRSTHRSSLSQVVYAGALANPDSACSWQQFHKALHTDLHSMHGETSVEGVHMGAMGGTLDILQRWYLGIHPELTQLLVAPAVPQQLPPTSLHMWYRGLGFTVANIDNGVSIQADSPNEDDLPIRTRDGDFRLGAGESKEIANAGDHDSF